MQLAARRWSSVALLAVLPAVMLPHSCGCTAAQQQALGLWGSDYQTTGEPVPPKVAAQRSLDQVREKYGLALDVVESLIDADVLDAPTLRAVRDVIKQVSGDPKAGTPGDIRDAQAKLDAGETIGAGFYIDRIRAAATTLGRVKDQHKGRAKDAR